MNATAITTPCTFNSATVTTTSTITTGNNLQLLGGSCIVYSGTPTTSLQLQGAQATTTHGIKMSVGTPSFQALTIIPTSASTAIITMLEPVTMNNNITLTTIAPVLGISPAQFTQLGGCNHNGYGIPNNMPSSSFRIIAATGSIGTPVVLPVGTYLFNGSVNFNCITAGTTSRIGCAFSTNSGALPTSPIDTQLSTSLDFTNNTNTYTAGSVNWFSSSCVVTVTTATIYYFIANWQTAASTTFTVGGSASFTRIA
jgi:hypothetical protein